MRKLQRKIKNWRPITAYSANYHLEAFLVSAIATVLGIRLFLELTGYPQLSGGGLHIAHMLYGGILMLMAITITSAFMGDRPKGIAAVLGGIGFGFFIDELGKFVTKNNDYFFEPTALLIYGVFIGLWFLFREIEQRRSHGQRSYQVNTLELLQEGLLYGFTEQELAQLESYLNDLEPNDSNKALKLYARHVAASAALDKPSLYIKTTATLGRLFRKFVNWRGFLPAVYCTFFIQAALSLFTLSDFLISIFNGELGTTQNDKFRAELGQLLGGTLYGVMIIKGLLRLRTDRLSAYRLFKTALLINIFVTQLFAFYTSQFSAVIGLLFNLMLLGFVDYLIEYSKHHRKRSSPSLK